MLSTNMVSFAQFQFAYLLWPGKSYAGCPSFLHIHLGLGLDQGGHGAVPP